MVKNWDIAIASSALLLIVSGLAAPHVRRMLSVGSAAARRRADEDLPAVV